jgi:glucose-6-phosphate-specific signal transduction histidine kinase
MLTQEKRIRLIRDNRTVLLNRVFNVAGMQERVQHLGGRISIPSRIVEGTEVNLWVPAHFVYENGSRAGKDETNS